MLKREYFKEQLEEDPDREYFNVIIYSEDGNDQRMLHVTVDKITEAYFYKYKIHGPQIRHMKGYLIVETI